MGPWVLGGDKVHQFHKVSQIPKRAILGAFRDFKIRLHFKFLVHVESKPTSVVVLLSRPRNERISKMILVESLFMITNLQFPGTARGFCC